MEILVRESWRKRTAEKIGIETLKFSFGKLVCRNYKIYTELHSHASKKLCL